MARCKRTFDFWGYGDVRRQPHVVVYSKKSTNKVYNKGLGMDIITHATSETSETFRKNRTLRRFCTTIYGKNGEVPTPPV